MSEKFVASNGVECTKFRFASKWVMPDSYFGVIVQGVTLGEPATEAMREFFLHERDEELGRWRDPENPDVVVYRTPYGDDRDGRRIEMVNERTNETQPAWENLVVIEDAEQPEGWAARYFAAHPESKPWHDAKPGEVWEFTYSQMGARDRYVAFVMDSFKRFRTADGVRVDLDECMVVSARRVYPEVSDVQ